jgi:glutamine amidotransferase
MVTIVDYGVGNIQAYINIYKRLNIQAVIARNPLQLMGAQKIIIPGVGAFDWAMQKLLDSGMKLVLEEMVLNQKSFVLGVCVGMQLMAKKSEEGVLPGLGWFDATVKRFDEKIFTSKTHLPHMGWNEVNPSRGARIFSGISNPQFYFLHSYYFSENVRSDILCKTDYCGGFTSGVQKGNIFGVQFHPEKSHQWGVKFLKNFAELG